MELVATEATAALGVWVATGGLVAKAAPLSATVALADRAVMVVLVAMVGPARTAQPDYSLESLAPLAVTVVLVLTAAQAARVALAVRHLGLALPVSMAMVAMVEVVAILAPLAMVASVLPGPCQSPMAPTEAMVATQAPRLVWAVLAAQPGVEVSVEVLAALAPPV